MGADAELNWDRQELQPDGFRHVLASISPSFGTVWTTIGEAQQHPHDPKEIDFFFFKLVTQLKLFLKKQRNKQTAVQT